MLPFEEEVSNFIKKHRLIEKGDHLLVAVSGGPDSLALLHFLATRSERFHAKITAAHIDHMIRGEASYNDLLFVESFCKTLQIGCETARIPILEKMKEEGLGLEETARKYRYGFLAETMGKIKANKVVFGHHGDDQIETVLMRLTRGTGGKGRAGIPFRRPFAKGEIIRPLLGTTKKEIESYCLHYRLKPRTDASNESPAYTRNRFRSVVLPFLKEENPQVHAHFQRFSEELLEDEAFLYGLAQEKIQEALAVEGRSCTLDIPKFKRMPLPLQRRGIHLILKYLYNSDLKNITAIHTDAIIKLAGSPHPSGRVDLPGGVKAVRDYGRCIFAFREPAAGITTYQYDLDEGMEIDLPNGYTIRLEKQEISYSYLPKNMLLLHVNDISLPLIVRTRKPGDRIEVKGLDGSKKVKDIFIDEKISKPERDIWPVVTDSNGTILWLPNLKKSRFEPNHVLPHETYYIVHYCKQTTSRGQSRDEPGY
ncbi:tRNA(Ile)-lysidine synthase [Weizmannia acidilactici]|uniref:tRNA(Ile)-lysidine synthase n=1 Tax=Weizmannia acidilactici TaxID=2607726 RepID=A0A5J4JLG2_9BACI|nr:tRNA lysidine(34) synthetase TilS [Weizmannia acidilactici]GER67628.1 tRNA(Ile)-lysidine synthase [Weizmannia acidilactici]GER71227.1 tRNA(Ile)-lysidine synthase [Weizmannia acidilactici]GER74656.1 tRNA(Ile)-lysidine synthase [Weizmannia acidilactici]